MCTFSSSNKAFNLAVALIAVMLFMISCNCLQAVAAPRLESRCNQDGTWGIVVGDAGMASIEQPQPMQLEIWDAAKSETRSMSAGYASLTEDEAGLIGAGRLTLADDVSFQFKDCWNLDHGVLYLDRSVEVNGNAPGGFLSGAVLRVASPQTWPQIEWFAPGMIYGNFDLIPGFAIGGRDYYRPGAYTVRIREDRLPAPLVAALFGDHSSLAVLNRVPRGDSTAAEAMSFSFDVMVDESLGLLAQRNTIRRFLSDTGFPEAKASRPIRKSGRASTAARHTTAGDAASIPSNRDSLNITKWLSASGRPRD